MHRSKRLISGAVFAACALMISCGSLSRETLETPASQSVDTSPAGYIIELREGRTVAGGPYLHSAALAVLGDDWLFIGGRKDGFHGRIPDSAFRSSLANDSLWVLNVARGERWGVPVPQNYRAQFTSTNMEHYQEGNTLYLAGGFTTASLLGPQSNSTSNRFTAIDIDSMIKAVKQGRDTESAILYSHRDTLFQVTGGGMVAIGDTLYLVMGQRYDTVYSPGTNGRYTLQIRGFTVDATGFSVTGTYHDTEYPADAQSRFRRRDLNVVKAFRSGRPAISIFGGAFTFPDDDGWAEPVYIDHPLGKKPVIRIDTSFSQDSNQYEAAGINMYDSESGTMFTTLLGGIGTYRYDAPSNKLVKGDNGAKLPFVKLITTIADRPDGSTDQFIQSPLTGTPMMPGWLGANAYFVPDDSLLFLGDILDYQHLSTSMQRIGLFYGGIEATAPTSGSGARTAVNRKTYTVYARLR